MLMEKETKPPLYLDCIHCGLCLSSCPTYRVLGNEMDSPRGRIYLMRAFEEGRTKITDTFVEHMMEETRAKIIEERPAHWISRLVLKHVFPYPWRFQLASRMLQLYRHSG